MSRQSQHWRLINKRRWAKVRLQVLESAGYRCAKCGRSGRMEVDHVVPLHAGGAMYELTNLQALDRNCHISKTRLENSRPNPARTRWAEFVKRRMQEVS